MSRIIEFADLTGDQQKGARTALEALGAAINVVTGTLAAAVAQTADGYYSGSNFWLSGPTHIHAEVAAIASAASANDLQVIALYLAQRRVDGRDPSLLMPCGSCRQLIFDLAVLTGRPVTIFSLTDKLDRVQVVAHADLLPEAFESQKLRVAGKTLALGGALEDS
jgi:cytidine deaminase